MASISASVSTKRTAGAVTLHKRLLAKKLKEAADAERGLVDPGPTDKAQAVGNGRRAPVSINKEPVDDFRRRLDYILSKDPQYDIKSVFKAIKQLPIARVYETAFDVLVKHKRPDDGANVLLQMQKNGLLASDETLAKTMTMTLSLMPPEEVDYDVVFLIGTIVGQESYTERQFEDLLKLMRLYDIDRHLISIVVNHFREMRESQGPYFPRLELVPDLVEALALEGKAEQAVDMLESVDVPYHVGRRRSVAIAYTRLLVAIRETNDWDEALAGRIERSVVQHKVRRQIPMTLMLAWAVSCGKYNAALEIYTMFQRDRDLVIDAYVFRALFEIPLAFNYSDKALSGDNELSTDMGLSTVGRVSVSEVAPRRLFRSMVISASGQAPIVVPDTALLATALAAFVHQRDYAAALVALRAFATYNAPLDPGAFYVVVKPLIQRMWGDLAGKRRLRTLQVKWGDRFLGVPFGAVRLSETTVARILDQVSREVFRVADPLGAPTAVEVPHLRLAGGAFYTGIRREVLEASWGPVVYAMPSMELMETVGAETDVLYKPDPLERLLRRALVAEIILSGEEDVDTAIQKIQGEVRLAEEEMGTMILSEKARR
ncbi:hypothetical protein HYPSUDRAFT_49145 [Hypholoma sublateritium FD-334 SS-4]|uniref:Uncharacterized protein n=1 Tax=Hypholoma sublateritium (strain FD-334 SS-4) TaxID=945553 RepID=A0A0D2P1D1_HYPSF|nr:hypothetical protein HYPSUDRAFT_49145 [Hypholoma sublateritium FD-334 SS-4]